MWGKKRSGIGIGKNVKWADVDDDAGELCSPIETNVEDDELSAFLPPHISSSN